MDSGNIITEVKEVEKNIEIEEETKIDKEFLTKAQQKELFSEVVIEKSKNYIVTEEKKEKILELQQEQDEIIQEDQEIKTIEEKKVEVEKKELEEEMVELEDEKENLDSNIEMIEENSIEELKNEEKEEVVTVETLEEVKIEKREAKNIVVPVEDSMLVESGIEIKYTSLQLRNFPIHYSNFANETSFKEVISVGSSSVKIGDFLLNNASMKILVYDKFKLLEIKTREFKIALSIDLLNGETLVKNGDFYKYEIFNKIKTSRFIEVLNIFKEIFKGTKIEFKYKKLVGEISFENRIEVYKFSILQEITASYKNIIDKLSLNREKNIVETTNEFYEIFLTENILENEKFDSWINFRIKNNYDIQPEDKLTFEKVHKLNFKGINFDIKEIIKVKDKISEREFTKDNEVCSYRKAVEIFLEKVEKIN